MTCARIFAFAFLLPTLMPPEAAAFEKLDGWYIALERCEAMQSENKGTNPGEVMTDERRAYNMIGINKKGGDHYQMRVPGAPVTEERWVRGDCGVHFVAAGTAPMPGPEPTRDQTPDPAPDPRLPPVTEGTESDDNLLALSWQPAFCETKPDITECRQLNAGQLPQAETQLSVHGLWPQPRGNEYCGVPDEMARLDKAGRWHELPEVAVDRETRAALKVAMPGTASHLDRHEWIKHGTLPPRRRRGGRVL